VFGQFGIDLVEEVGAEVGVGRVAGEHVPDGSQDGVPQRDQGLLLPDPSDQAAVAGAEPRVFGA
jgi:hypothetical protein